MFILFKSTVPTYQIKHPTNDLLKYEFSLILDIPPHDLSFIQNNKAWHIDDIICPELYMHLDFKGLYLFVW